VSKVVNGKQKRKIGARSTKLAKMISRAGYWGSCCSSKCGYCDRWPRFNKSAQRKRERKQWRKDFEIL